MNTGHSSTKAGSPTYTLFIKVGQFVSIDEIIISIPELIPQNFIFLRFLIFAAKLSQFITQENNAIAIKQPSLKAKK
jgi:hypothetical protein